MRFFNTDTQAVHAPRVGDSLAVARWRDSSPESSPITAEVTAVRWNDLDFQAATVFLRGTEAAIDFATLTGGSARWVDEDA